MAQHVDSSQSADMPPEPLGNENDTQCNNDEASESVRDRWRKLADETVDGKRTVADFIQSLKDLGLNASEANDNVEEVKQRIELRNAKARQPNPSSREATPQRDNEDENTGDSQVQAVESAAWEALQAKLDYVAAPLTHEPALSSEQITVLLCESKVSSGSPTIPASVLSVAPGTWAFARPILAQEGVCAASVTGLTKHEMSKNVSRNLISDDSNIVQHSAVAAKVEEARSQGPRSLRMARVKRPLDDSLSGEPRFRRGFIWDPDISSSPMSPSALDTESALPLPSPPQHLIDNPVYRTTLEALKGSIKVETPFNVDRFESLLHDHPNQLFVKSVMRGLREGFWPFSDGGDWLSDEDDPLANYSSEEEDLETVRAFRDKEISAGRWSEAKHNKLLPGMKSSPLFVVWQKNKPRVVTDHSASGLNESIPKIEAKVPYDDMRSFGQAMFNAKSNFPNEALVSWKSDVASAFLNLPAHPLWQIRQVVKVDGVWYIVHRLVFGNRASPRCWCSVSALMCWVGIKKLNITDLHVFMDDFYSWDFANNMVTYQGVARPKNQAKLLILWDAIGCPWEEKKQEFGETLKIIGFWVDINRGTITLSDDSVADIVSKIKSFIETPSRRPSLCTWQRLAGHLNWLPNVLPWGRPALTEMYRKMAGKENMHAGIYLNKEVMTDMNWLAEIIPGATGIRLLETMKWNNEAADMILWTNASLKSGMAFVYEGNGFVYQIAQNVTPNKVDILFLELMTILSAISHIAVFAHPPRRLLIFTDSLDSVAVFNTSGAAESLHNSVVRAVAGIILRTGIDLKVCHIPGKDNIRANLLSRLLFNEYKQKFPADRVRKFEPPRDLLPVRWRVCF